MRVSSGTVFFKKKRTAVTQLYGRVTFFPVRPCHGVFRYGRVTGFSGTTVSRIFSCTAVLRFFLYGRVTRCVHTYNHAYNLSVF